MQKTTLALGALLVLSVMLLGCGGNEQLEKYEISCTGGGEKVVFDTAVVAGYDRDEESITVSGGKGTQSIEITIPAKEVKRYKLGEEKEPYAFLLNYGETATASWLAGLGQEGEELEVGLAHFGTQVRGNMDAVLVSERGEAKEYKCTFFAPRVDY